MLPFTFYSPTYFAFGEDTENQAGALVRRFGGARVLLHYGKGSAVKSGLIDRVKRSLSEAGVAFVELGGVAPNPRSGLVYEGIELGRREKVDFLLAVGGGSVIDSAKAIAAGIPYDGDFWDFYKGKPVKEALPVGTVLTIPAAGSEGSPNTVITREETLEKRGMGSDLLRPAFSILNPALTQTLPAYQTACGAADIMTHVFERYFTNTEECEITDRMCEAVLSTIVYEMPRVMANPNHYEARANIMWAGMLAHNNLCGVGREQDWASHDIEHELSAQYDVAHGAGLAVIVPAWMKYVYRHDIARFAQLAVRVFGVNMDFQNQERTALEGVARLQGFWRSLGLPANLRELGARAEDIPMMARRVNFKGREKIGGFVPLAVEDIEKIYQLAW